MLNKVCQNLRVQNFNQRQSVRFASSAAPYNCGAPPPTFSVKSHYNSRHQHKGLAMAAISIRDLVKVYPNGLQALHGISLDVQEGDFFALLGPNGAGKSTTIGIIFSLINKTSGTINVFGQDIDTNFALAKSYLGIVPQEFNISVFEKVVNVLIHQAGYYGVPHKLACERAEKYLKKLELWDKRNAQVRMLSGGMKRRLMIARALLHEPKMLILDEPTAGVDIEIRRSMWTFLREINEQGTTVILTTHYLEEAESLCRNIAIIDQGKIVSNTSMQALLQTLNTESFIFYLAKPIQQKALLPQFETTLIDPYTLEVAVTKEQTLNEVFHEFAQQNIIISSMRNKVNRLEELFLQLTSKTNHEYA